MRQIGGKMKKIFILILVFLFLSCSNGGKRTVDNDSSAENTDTGDIGNIDADDIEFSDENDTETVDDSERCYTWPDEDSENTDDEYPENDDNEDEPIRGICLEEPCKDVENSTGECLTKGESGDYVCVCRENFVWFPNKKTCEPLSSFKGLSCTGQIKCYDNEKEIPCPKAGEPFFGQDANYAEERECIPQNFTIKNYGPDKTVIDNNSKLEWTQQVSVVKNPYTISVGGYYDWRTATFQDYHSIIDSGTFAPAINEAYFPNTPSDIFVTEIEEYLNHTGPQEGYYYYVIVGMNFKTGLAEYESGTGKPETLNFRSVRDLPEKPESCGVTLQSDEYKLVNLLPQKLLFIRTPEEGKNWQEALEYCENLNYAGISDWRLPNRNETYFFSTISNLHQDEHISTWSSTTYTKNPREAIFYSLSTGYNFNTNKTTWKADANYCVAFDPCPEGQMWTGEKCTSSEGIIFFKDKGCGCIQGYTWKDSHCVKTCSDDLCKNKAHSTGLCLQTIDDGESQKVKCQCEKNYFLNENFECINPCDADPCSGKEEFDGSCVPTGLTSFTCGCSTDYYPKSNDCIPVKYNDCYTEYNDDACINDVSNIMWSSISDGILTWKDAKKHCDDLDEAGYTDWRLPKVEELWTFAKSCTNIPKESCEASEKNCCLSEECIAQCKCRIFQEPNPVDYLWSSSFKIDDPQKVIIFYKYYAILEFFDTKTDVAKVKCVRNIE